MYVPVARVATMLCEGHCPKFIISMSGACLFYLVKPTSITCRNEAAVRVLRVAVRVLGVALILIALRLLHFF